MARRFGALGAIFLVLFLSGCSIPVFTKPVTVSTNPIPGKTEHGDAKLVTGTSCSRTTLIFIPLGFGSSDSAFEDALAQAPGTDTLVDWRLKEETLAIVLTILYAQSCVTVEGYAVNSSKVVKEAADPSAARRYVSYWQQRRTDVERGPENAGAQPQPPPSRAARVEQRAAGL
jgi:hypothetical protein